jgi:hypothetical protein
LKTIEETHLFWKKLREISKDEIHTPLMKANFDWDNFEEEEKKEEKNE